MYHVQNLRQLRLQGLWSTITTADIQDYFKQYGEVVRVQILPNTGCGFVEFLFPEEAERALEKGERVVKGVFKHYIKGKNFTAEIGNLLNPGMKVWTVF